MKGMAEEKHEQRQGGKNKCAEPGNKATPATNTPPTISYGQIGMSFFQTCDFPQGLLSITLCIFLTSI